MKEGHIGLRVNLLLATIFTIIGLLTGCLFFIFVNFQIPFEPFTTWSQLPYANMFQYAGLICLFGAIIYLVMEIQEDLINKNNFLIFILILINIIAFLAGEYHTLTPVLYIIGFFGISIINFWLSNKLETKDLFILAVSATIVSLADEYAHTSVGTLSYYDKAIPSPLTIFGWSLFMIFIVGISRLIIKTQSLQIKDNKKLRILPVIITLILILAVIMIQDYLSIFNWVLISLYLFLFATSFYYTYTHPLKWNLFLMITSLILGLTMEFLGGQEGLWTFRFQESISFLILFSWPLRIWAVNFLCQAFKIDFSKNN
jgi:hypothetical protein